MPSFLPGDQCVVMMGAHLSAVIGNEECWNDKASLGIVVSKSHRVGDHNEEDLVGFVNVLIPNRGVFLTSENSLMTLDEFGDPSRLFPPQRLREP